MDESLKHHFFADLLDGCAIGSDGRLAALRATLQNKGINSRGWRIYLEMGDALFEPLRARLHGRQTDERQRDGIALLALVQSGEMAVPPPRELVAALCNVRLLRQGLEALPAYLFRAAWKECARLSYRNGDTAQWVSEEAIPVFEWFLRTDQVRQMDDNRRRANWSSYVDRWEQWLDQPAKPGGTRQWRPLLPRMECRGFVVSELCHEEQLFAEGEAMSHCVAIFIGDCLRSEVHVFSIADRRSRTRLATLALSRAPTGHWEITQLKAYGNQPVTAMRGVEEVAMALLQCVEDAHSIER